MRDLRAATDRAGGSPTDAVFKYPRAPGNSDAMAA